MDIKLLTLLLCACFWRAGGQWKGWIRDVLVPLTIGILLLILHTPWWVAFITVGSYQIIRLGYGINSPLKKLFKKEWLVRAVYGGICACVGALPLVVYTHAWLGFFLYILACSLIMGLIVYLDDTIDWINVWWVELISGAIIGSVVYFVQ